MNREITQNTKSKMGLSAWKQKKKLPVGRRNQDRETSNNQEKGLSRAVIICMDSGRRDKHVRERTARGQRLDYCGNQGIPKQQEYGILNL